MIQKKSNNQFIMKKKRICNFFVNDEKKKRKEKTLGPTIQCGMSAAPNSQKIWYSFAENASQ